MNSKEAIPDVTMTIITWLVLTPIILFICGWLDIPLGIATAGYLLVGSWSIYRNKSKHEFQLPWMAWLMIAVQTAVLASFSWRQRAGEIWQIYERGAHDAWWHMALTGSVTRSVPPENPVLAGVLLSGYHYLSNVWWAGIHQLTGIPLGVIYLQVAPAVLAGIFAVSAIFLLRRLFANQVFVYLGSCLVTLGSGFAYLAPIWYPGASSDQSVFWLDQPAFYGINQQLFLSLIVINVIWYWLTFSTEKKWWWLGVLLGSLMGIKVYAALVVIPAGWLVILISQQARKNWAKIWLVGTAVAGILALLSGSSHGWPFIWEPGWFVKTMFESSDHLNKPEWEIHRQLYVGTQNWVRWGWHWLSGTAVFWLGNLGVKNIGLLAVPILIRLQKKNDSPLLLWGGLMVVISMLWPTLWLQKGVAWNTIQFAHYSAVPLVVLLMWLLQSVFTRSKLQIVSLILLTVLALPTTIQIVFRNFDQKNYHIYPRQITDSLSQLKRLPNEKTLIVGSILAEDSMVPALADRSVFWADPGVLTITNQVSDERQKKVNSVASGIESCPIDWIWVTLNGETVVVDNCQK